MNIKISGRDCKKLNSLNKYSIYNNYKTTLVYNFVLLGIIFGGFL